MMLVKKVLATAMSASISQSIVIIPARLASQRLPGKPLHIIGDKPLLSHVIDQAKQYYKGRIVVGGCAQQVIDLAHAHHVEAIITPPGLPSGTDRVHAVYQLAGKGESLIVCLQGDMAVFPQALIEETLKTFEILDIDVATAVCPYDRLLEKNDPSVVKVAIEWDAASPHHGHALFFSRSPIPFDQKVLYKHIGIYVYKPQALQRFVEAPVGSLETQERLEQLRGLAIGLRYGVVKLEEDAFSVDTLDDVTHVEQYFANQAS